MANVNRILVAACSVALGGMVLQGCQKVECSFDVCQATEAPTPTPTAAPPPPATPAPTPKPTIPLTAKPTPKPTAPAPATPAPATPAPATPAPATPAPATPAPATPAPATPAPTAAPTGTPAPTAATPQPTAAPTYVPCGAGEIAMTCTAKISEDCCNTLQGKQWSVADLTSAMAAVNASVCDETDITYLKTGRWCEPTKKAGVTLYEEDSVLSFSAMSPSMLLGGLVLSLSLGLMVAAWRRTGRRELEQTELLAEDMSEMDQ